MSNGTDPLVDALRKGTARFPGATRENLVASRTVAFPFKKLGKYDKGITSAIYEGALNDDPLLLQEYYRGDMQSKAKKLLNGTVSRGLSIGTKVGQGFGHVLGAGHSILSGDAFSGDWAKVWENPLAEAFADMDEGLKEVFPVHLSQQYGEGNLLAKMGTATFWASDFADGLAFMASAYAPGSLIGKGVKALKGIEGLTKSQFLKGLKAIGLNSSNVTVGVSSIYNTVSEAGVEAYHINKSIREDLIRLGVDEDEAKLRAGEAAASTFGLNMATLWLSNIPQSQWFHGSAATRHATLRKLVKDGELNPDEITSKFSLWKSALKGAASEGLWEENVQTAIERYNTRFANRETDADWLSGITTEAWTNVKGFLKTFSPFHDSPAAGSPEDEGATAIFLGALLGSPMSAYGEYSESVAELKEMGAVSEWWKKSLNYGKDGLLHFHEDVKSPYKEFTYEDVVEEDGQTKVVKRNSFLNKDNRTEVDKTKMSRILLRHFANKRYFDESVIAAMKNDAIHDTLNKHMGFASYVYSLYTNDLIGEEDIIDVIEASVKASSKTDELGANTFAQENIALAKSYVEELKQIDQQIAGEYDFQNNPGAKSFKLNIRKSLLAAKVRSRVAGELLSSTNDTVVKAATNLKEDADQFLEGFSKNKQKIWEAYSKVLAQYEEALLSPTKPEFFEKNYIANELVETQNITNSSDPYFAYIEPLTVARDARRSATDRTTLAEEDAASRGDVYMRNHAIQESIDDNENIANTLDSAEKVAEILLQTRLKLGELNTRIESQKKTKEDRIQVLSSTLEDIEFGEADFYLKGVLGEGYTSTEAEAHAFDLMKEQETLRDEVSVLNSFQDRIQAVSTSNKKYKPSNKPLVIQYLEKVLGDTDQLIQKFKSNPKDFTDLARTLDALKLVNNLIQLFSTRTDLKQSLKDQALVLLQKRLSRLLAAEKIAAENVQNKSKANLIKEQQKVVSLKAALDFNDLKDTFANSPLGLALREHINIDEWLELNRAYTTSEGTSYTNSYAAVLSLIEAIRNAPNKSEIIKLLKANKKAYANNLLGSSGVLTTTADNYRRSPNTHIFTIIEIYARSLGYENIYEDTSLPFYEWKKSNDIYAFRDALRTLPNSGNLINMVTLHIASSSIGTVLDFLESPASYKEIFEVLDSSISELSPSLEQIMAASEITAALLGKQDGERYANAVYLRGPAGSGKTTLTTNLVLQAFTKLFKSSKNQVLVTGHKKISADNIGKELEMPPTYLEDILNKDLTPYRLIIVDEAAGLTAEQGDLLFRKVNDHNKTVPENSKVRLFLLGDPSQITKQSTPMALQSGHVVEPITTIFRTNVGAIEETFIVFKDNPTEVDGVTTRASHGLFEAKTTNESLFGVMTGASLDLIEVLKARQNGDGRTRVVIVNNNAQKAPYQGIPGVDVLTYEEAQSLTYDEVYLDMNMGLSTWENRPFKSPLEYNTGVYTGMSRARYFVFTTTPGLSSIKSDSVSKTYENNKDLLASIKEQYGDYYAAHKFFLEKFNGEQLTPPVAPPVSEEVISEEAINEEIPEEEPTSIPTMEEEKQAEESPRQDDIETITQSDGQTSYSHYVYYPDNVAVSDAYDYSSGKGYILKVPANNELGYNLTVVAQDSNGAYNVVAVLSNKDFSDGQFGEALTHEWNKVQGDSQHPLNKGFSTQAPLSGEDSKLNVQIGQPVMEVKIDRVSPLDVKIDPQGRFRDMGDNFLGRLLSYAYERIFKNSKLGADPRVQSLIPGPDGLIDMDKIDPSKVYLEIFSRKTAAQVPGKFKPKPGRVYLVIADTAPKGSSRLQTNPILIPLANLPFSKESYYYQQIRPFYDAVAQIESLTNLRLGDGLFEGIVRALAEYNYVGTKQNNKYVITPSDKPLTMAQILKKVPGAEALDSQALEALAEQFGTIITSSYGIRPDKIRMTQEEYEASEYANDQTYELNREPGQLKGILQKVTLDSQTGEKVPSIEGQPQRFVLIANNGPAQKAIDELARENTHVGDTRLRLVTLSSRDKSDMILLSRTLIRGRKSDHDYVYGQFRKAYERLSGKSASGISGEQIQKLLVEEGYYEQSQIDQAIAAHVTPHFTSDILKLIVDFSGKYHAAPTTGGNPQQKGQRYLREPIRMFDFNNYQGRHLNSPGMRAKIEEMVASKVLAINPLAVKITITSDRKPSGQSSEAYTLTEKQIGAPLSLFEEIPQPSVEEVKKKIKAKKNKKGWIKRSDLDVIVADLGTVFDIVGAIEEETKTLLKVNEEAIVELPATIINPIPTTADTIVTEEDLIARIKAVNPKIWEQIKGTITGTPEERYNKLLKIYRAINTDDLHDEINFAFDGARMGSVSKALGKILNEKKAKNLLRRLIPGINPSGEEVRFIAKELLQALAKPGEDLWGLWMNGVLFIAYEERNGVRTYYENVIRHEVFHRIYQTHLNQKERESLRRLTDTRYNTENLSDYDYQEWLAKKYQSWRLGEKVRGFLLKYFKWIARLLDFTLNNRDELSTLFNRIDYGFYTSSTYLDSSHASTQAMKFIKEDFHKMDIFKDAVNIVKRAFNKYLYIDPSLGGGHNGLVVSESEAIYLMKQEFLKLLTHRKTQLKEAEEVLAEYGEDSVLGLQVLNSLPEMHIRIGALEVLTQIPERGKSPFQKLVSYLYPNSIYLKEMEEVTDEETIEDKIAVFEDVIGTDTQTGVAAQIEENETKNHELKLSATMRHWLSSIMKDTKVPVSERYAYFQMLQFFQTLDLNMVDPDLKNIQEQMKYIRANNTLGEAADKVLGKLFQTLKEATARTYKSSGDVFVPIPSTKNIVLKHHELTGRTDYYFIQGENASKYTFFDEVKDNLDISVFKHSGEELIPIYNELAANGLVSSRGEFNVLYKRAVARDVIRAAQNNFHMKEMDIRIATQVNNFGRTYLRYIKGRTLGVNTSIKSTIREALTSYVRSRKHTKEIGTFSKVEALLKASPLEGIQLFLKQLGLAYLAKDFHPVNAATLADTIIETINSAPKEVEDVERSITHEDDDTTEIILVDVVEEWIEDNESIINEFSEALKFNFEWLRNTSVRSGDKKKLYKFSNSSYLHDLMYRLLESLKFVGSTGNRAFRDLPDFLKTDFFSKNIFVNGLIDKKTGANRAMLYEMDYHDSYRNEYTQAVRTYDRENKAEWLRREFIYGFLGGLATSRNKVPSYHQFTYPLADRTRIPVFRTKLLSEEAALDAIKEAIKQIRDRNPNLTFFKKYNAASNINFELYTEDLHKFSVQKAAEAVLEKLKEAGKQTARRIVEEELPFPNDLQKAVDKARTIDKSIPKYEKDFRSKQSGKYVVTPESIERLAELYEINTYINSYFINQIFGGDTAFYAHSADLIKRLAGPSAPGTSPFVNDDFGMSRTFKLAVVDDKSIPFSSKDEETSSVEKFLLQFLSPEEFGSVKDYFSKKGFDMTDAQGFVTPERMNDIRRGFGTAYGLGNVLKPVYYAQSTTKIPYGTHPYDTEEAATKAMESFEREGLLVGPDTTQVGKFMIYSEESYPIYLKYSTVVLSDELIKQFPYLENIRSKMRRNSVDELIFRSGVKVGKPSVISKAEAVEVFDEKFSFSNVMELENEHYRMQLNPRHDPNERVSMFTQLTYFLNVFNFSEERSNDAQARLVYQALAYLVKKGLLSFQKSSKNPSTLARKLLDTPGYEQALELLEAGISLNNPSLEKLLVTQFAAKLSNDTVNRIKFSGGKYTLQSAYGIFKNKLGIKDVPTGADELAYKVSDDGSIYAEMIFPKGVLSVEQEAAAIRGDELFLYGDAFAFRIPSTELHSAVSIKVVGIYDDLKTNVIIGPKELVPLHGSDFDADSLSVIVRSRASTSFEFGKISIKEGDFIGYTKSSRGYIIDKNFAAALSESMDAARLTGDKSAYNKLQKLEDEFLKNLVAETMMEVIRHPNNRPRMLTPISMERFNGEYGGQSMKLLLEEAGDTETQKKYDVSSSEGRYMAFKSIFDGAALTGVFANAIKALAYMIKSGPTDTQKQLISQIDGLKESLKVTKDPQIKKELKKKILDLTKELEEASKTQSKSLPAIKKEFRVTFDGTEYMSLSELEAGTKLSIWETLDALINSAIDNAKEQILFMIGANGITANAISSLVGMGVPLKTTVFFMRQPIIKELSKSKYKGRAELGIVALKARLMEKMTVTPEDSSLSTEDLQSHIKPSSYELDWESMTSIEAEHYYKVVLQFEKAWKVGESLSDMAAYLNIVREMPVTAEAAGKLRQTIQKIGDFTFEVDDASSYNGFKGSSGFLGTSDTFAFEIPNFLSNNPHIAIAHTVFEHLEKLLENTFFVHSKLVKGFIKSLGLTSQIKLAKGDINSTILNRIEYAREFLKYLMSSIYSNKFNDTPQYFFSNYKGELEYLEGSKAWFQHFINKIEALQKHVAALPDQKGNYFLSNLSISGTGIRSIRYTAGSNLKYEDILLARDAFEELNKYEIIEREGHLNPSYEVVVSENPERFTQFQRDFIVYSILNNGLQYSITSLSQVLSPELFIESDAQLQEVISLITASEQMRDNIRGHFKISMVGANAEQLPWIPKDSENSRIFMASPKMEYVVFKDGTAKELPDTSGVHNGNYYDLAFENLKHTEEVSHESNFPLFIRTSSGNTAAAHIRMNDPASEIVYYQRIGHAPSGFYDIADLDTFYSLDLHFNLKLPTTRVISITGDTITSSRDLTEFGEAPFAITTYSDVTRSNRRFVKIQEAVGRVETGQFVYKVVDAFKDANEAQEYLNSLLAEDDTVETYTVTIFEETGYMETNEGIVTKSLDSISKYTVDKPIDEATKYIKDNGGEIKILPKHCKYEM